MNPSSRSRDTLLITGASGLIGTRLCKAFENEFTVCDLDVAPPSPAQASAVDYLKTDLTDDASVRKSLEMVRDRHGSRVASVVHLAAYYDFSGEPSPLYEELTVKGTRRLLRGLRDLTFDVEQFIFSSSLLVMAPDEEGGQISEQSEVRGGWAYPQSKVEAEQVIREERGDIPTVILRIAGIYDERCHSLPLSQQIARIYEKRMESYLFPGDATHGQALVHLDDLVDCFRRAIDRRRDLGPEEIFLIAEPDVLSYEDLQDRLGDLIHQTEWATIRIPKVVAKAGAWVKEKLADEEHPAFIKPWMIDLADDHYAADIARAQQKLGWNPSHRLNNTLPAMIEFLKRDQEGFYQENKLPPLE